MKVFNRLFAFFPLVQMILISTSLLLFIKSLTLIHFLSLIFVTYFFAPIVWRIVHYFLPVKKGLSYLGKNTNELNVWFISYHLQQIYNTIPMIENLLKLIPGAYSFWLRVWGANIGKKVNWTSQCFIVDRPFVHIGDRCLIGNQAYISAHAIKKKEDRYILYLNDVMISSDVVLAVQCLIGPGVKIKDKAFVSARAGVKPNHVIPAGESYEKIS